jgi:SAM-dependent methyltransferase
MSEPQWYETLFANYARKYDQEHFTRGTVGECDFIERELDRNKSLRILDAGCGTGRHAIELTRRGYDLTGFDLSEAQIRRAREKAAAERLDIEFLVHDARDLPFANEFDVVLMLCEGGFPLMETDEMNFAILENLTRALRTPGIFIFTTLNGLFPLHHSIQEFTSDTEGGGARYHGDRFDLLTFRNHSFTEFEDDDGRKHSIACHERYYVPPEITWMLKSLGYRTIDIFGAKQGAFSREDALSVDDFEMLVIARK